jgi:hypothetical protein
MLTRYHASFVLHKHINFTDWPGVPRVHTRYAVSVTSALVDKRGKLTIRTASAPAHEPAHVQEHASSPQSPYHSYTTGCAYLTHTAYIW